MSKELWMPVPDLLDKLTPEQNQEWVNKYRISNFGRIYSVKNKKVLKPSKLKTGYLVLSTKIGGRSGKALAERIHRLVAKQFLPNPEGKPEVNHKNGDKTNNTVVNLEWTTPSENCLHSVYVLGNKTKKGHENPLSALNQDQESYIRLKYKPRDKQFGARALARELGVHHKTVLKVLKDGT